MIHHASKTSLATLVLLLAGALGATPVVISESQEAAPPFVITDQTGDVYVLVNSGSLPAQYPANPATNPVDIESLSIEGEDALGLTVKIKLVNLNGLSNPAAALDFSNAYYNAQFKLGGTEITYYLNIYVDPAGAGETKTGVESARTYLSVYVGGNDEGPWWANSYEQRVTGSVNWDEGYLAARISKDALMGRDPLDLDRGIPQNIPVLGKGHNLADFIVYTGSGFPTFLTDRLPDRQASSERYALRTESANTKVRLSLAQQASAPEENSDLPSPQGRTASFAATPGAVSVTPGTPTLIPIRVENLNMGKRFINLTAQLDEPKDAAKWSLQVVPTISVPGRDMRVVNLIVNATPAIQHRETANATLFGTSLGFADELGALRLTLVGSVPPGPERKSMYFHARPGEAGNVLADAICSAPFFCDLDERWMNTLESDPLSGFEQGIPFDQQSFLGSDLATEFGQTFTTDTPLGQDLVLDVNQPVEAILAVEGPATFTGTLTLELMAGPKFIGTESVTTDFQPGGTVAVSFLPLIDAKRISVADGALTCRITLETPTAGAGSTGTLDTLRLIPSKSKLSLPIIRDPNATLVNALPLGPAFVTLTSLGDAEEFVNPGRTKIYNATVTNEGVQADEVTLTVLADQPDWTVTISPGNRFNLKPGESAKVGFLIKAPSTAQESDQLQILVNATSTLGGSMPLSQLRLVAVVTTNIDIPDEAGGFIVEEETATKLAAGTAKKSPGVAAPLLALALLGLVAFGRRRRAA